jgi:hypothetical protein
VLVVSEDSHGRVSRDDGHNGEGRRNYSAVTRNLRHAVSIRCRWIRE